MFSLITVMNFKIHLRRDRDGVEYIQTLNKWFYGSSRQDAPMDWAGGLPGQPLGKELLGML